ncbi:MAG: SGNH/GDSL hydrolase family protein [Lachnospiraceae bacterium]|nr:SGNH/GDSL hydrolase family protein [Lachnospiraceae bacterium]
MTGLKALRKNEEAYKEMLNDGIIAYGNLDRMKMLFEKQESGKPLVIAFIGGSVTQGFAATMPTTCYAYRVYDWFCNRFPDTQVSYVNAGIGATDSYFGVARVQEDVLAYKPDFILFEYSVNDPDNEFYKETYEGLVRRLLKAPGFPAVMALDNVVYADGSGSQRVHNEITKAYGIPTVSIRESVYRRILDGQIAMSEITSDGLHPNDAGHKLVADVICNLLRFIDRSDGISVPVTDNRFENCVRLTNKEIEPMQCYGFSKDEMRLENSAEIFKNGWYGSLEGSFMTFRIKCTGIGIQYRKTKDLPAQVVRVTLDHDPATVRILDANFDETWGDLAALECCYHDLPNEEHELSLEIIEAHEDDVKPFYVASLIVV